MNEQVAFAAHLQQATQLPYSAIKPILHLDFNHFTNDDSAHSFSAMMEYEASSNSKEKVIQYSLCGPQKTAKQARSEISQYYSGRVNIVYASRVADVACWRASLTSDQAEKLGSSSAFFHVTQVPSIAKFAPELVSLGSDNKVFPASQAIMTGVRVQIERTVEHRGELFNQWHEDHFGMLSHDRTAYLYPLSDDGAVDSWKSVRNAMETGHCPRLIKPTISKHTKDRTYLLHIEFEELGDASAQDVVSTEDCVVAALAYLATQSEVVRIEPIPTFVLHSLIPNKNEDRVFKSPSDIDDVEVGAEPLNTVSTTALQSGDESDPNPFWDLSINGTGQYVEVSDTGFDDASCFLRQANSADYLTGSLNTAYQVTRSGYSSPVTDHSRRKVVQYLMRDTSDSDYAQDYASGHGSHCAGTVAGYLPDDGSEQDPNDDYYSNCADYIAYCDSMFTATGSEAGTCDTTCGIAPTEAHSGMAPGAKLMVYDFGDASGGLDVPDDMQAEVYQPAYDEGARVTSNSWGAGAPYNYYDSQAVNIDTFIYDEDDVLVVFAAGNAAGVNDDDTYESGDASIGAPAICKNVLTVGAAETEYTPDTVASFSSRGPSKDMRLKPEVCGPGNPVTSIKASGSAGLASCATTAKSGTSMATPAVAGTAALIRQILTEGHHETFSSVGYAASSYSTSAPSGALLKALLIGSTVPLAYGYNSAGAGVTLSDFYGASSAVADSTAYALGTTGVDFTQGFGHVRLSNIFSLDGTFDTFCYEDSLAEYSTWDITFTISSADTDVAITLVWNDPPGSTYCGYYYEQGTSTDTCLVHDLDLKVYNDGTRLYSNFGAGDGDYSGQEDVYNNVEKTSIASSDLTVGDTITVTVETNGLSYADSQKFAVVVKGKVTSNNASPSLPPVPAPTPQPIPSSTPQPIPTPTTKPIPTPTPQPIPIPTPQPIPIPTPQPSNNFPNPTPNPTSIRPTSQPTNFPIPTPTLLPTNTPTLPPTPKPTSVPTLVPTTTDTVTIATSFDLTSTSEPDSDDEASLKTTVADELDVSETSIKDFTLTSTTSRRVRRQLLTTYTWTADFEVTVSLASTSSTSSDDLATSISSTLTSSSFTSSVSTNTGATVETSTVSTIPVTRSPTQVPVLAPTDVPIPSPTATPKKSKKSKKSNLGAATLGGIAVGAVLLLVGTCFLARHLLSHRKGDYEDAGNSYELNGNTKSPPPPPAAAPNVWISETMSPMTTNKNPLDDIATHRRSVNI